MWAAGPPNAVVPSFRNRSESSVNEVLDSAPLAVLTSTSLRSEFPLFPVRDNRTTHRPRPRTKESSDHRRNNHEGTKYLEGHEWESCFDGEDKQITSSPARCM